ncbi:hypothetical protein HDR58_08175 [bacterium]|nr:hypothetical protein [bacterium]
MDVSRITAVSPKQIDWRKLTAKEIIKYETQGVEVPTQYLQWAKEFQNDLNSGDKDDTTYETAIASGSNLPYQQDVNISEEEEENTEEPQKLSASEVKNQMLESGKSYLKVAKTFSEESKNRASLSENSEVESNNLGDKSDNKTENFETAITELLSEASDIKSQIESLKNSTKEKNLTNGMKIQKLQRQLKQLGVNGQKLAAQTDTDLNEYTPILEEHFGIGTETIDYGNVTVEMGEKVKSWIGLYGEYLRMGKQIIKSGENAQDKGDSLQNIAQEVNSKNKENLSTVSKKQIEILAKTGVGELSPSENKEDNKNEELSGEKTKSQQEIFANSNMEEILKYKIRKGENTEN